MFVVIFLVHLWLGSQHAEEPFVTIGQYATVFYFGVFLFFLPVFGVLENTLIDLETENKNKL